MNVYQFYYEREQEVRRPAGPVTVNQFFMPGEQHQGGTALIGGRGDAQLPQRAVLYGEMDRNSEGGSSRAGFSEAWGCDGGALSTPLHAAHTGGCAIVCVAVLLE